MANLSIRKKAMEQGVKLWEIAQALRIADSSFSRKLREELPAAETTRILAVIDEVAKNKAAATE